MSIKKHCSWADQGWVEFEQRERVKEAMRDMEHGSAAVLMENIARDGVIF